MPDVRKHILVVDDNIDILILLKTILEGEQYEVSVRHSAVAIDAHINEIMPDIIIMDMLLSGIDGRDICRKLKNNPATLHIPLIMISAHPVAKATCQEAGADYFLGKPFEINDLFDKVNRAGSKE